MTNYMRVFLTGCFLLLVSPLFSQVKISGIIVDSLSFKSLPNVNIQVKGKPRGTTSDEKGYFSIKVAPFDTLLISEVGYLSVKFPVLVDEEDIIIRMSEDVIYLQAVTVNGRIVASPLIKEKPEIVYRKPTTTKLMSGAGVSFDYFSKQQRERRKLNKLIVANEKVQAYAEVVGDPEFEAMIRKKYAITEADYYRIMTAFNQTMYDKVTSKTREEIIKILDDYFCYQSGRCR